MSLVLNHICKAQLNKKNWIVYSRSKKCDFTASYIKCFLDREPSAKFYFLPARLASLVEVKIAKMKTEKI